MSHPFTPGPEMGTLRIMTLGEDHHSNQGAPEVPVTDKGKMVAAGVLLLIPIVALMWVPQLRERRRRGSSASRSSSGTSSLWVFLCLRRT